MRAIIVLSFMLAAQTAEAGCHKYSRWYYPWPQSCHTLKFAAMARKPAPRRVYVPPPMIEPGVLLPDMSVIDWGKTLDEHNVGLIRLRAELEK